MTAPKKNRYKYTIVRKFGGDDKYSWAVFIRGRPNPVVTGLGRSEVDYHRNHFEKSEAAKR